MLVISLQQNAQSLFNPVRPISETRIFAIKPQPKGGPGILNADCHSINLRNDAIKHPPSHRKHSPPYNESPQTTSFLPIMLLAHFPRSVV